MGMDSLASIQLKKNIEADFGIGLSTTAALAYPNIEALAGHLAAEAFGADDPSSEPEDGQSAAKNDIKEEIDQLSDDEIEQSLLKELKDSGY